jgi:hypothetical protein
VKIGFKNMHTCSSSVLDSSKKSKQHLEEEKLEEKLNSKSIAQVEERFNRLVKPTLWVGASRNSNDYQVGKTKLHRLNRRYAQRHRFNGRLIT